MAARPPAAVLKKFAPSKEAADVVVREAAGTSVSVPGGAGPGTLERSDRTPGRHQTESGEGVKFRCAASGLRGSPQRGRDGSARGTL